jgi:hypothetical protein
MPFEDDVRNEIEKLSLSKDIQIWKKPLGEMKGVSGNSWQSDIVLERLVRGELKIREGFSLQDIEPKGILVIIECKYVTKNTYRGQMLMAYGQLGDLRNIKCPKFLVIPQKWSFKSEFNYDSYFETIGVKIIQWNDEKEKQEFLNEIKSITAH